jgi:Na+-driven multidrug efflux pump
VARTFVAYTRIIAFGYGMMEVHRYCGFFLTGLHKPLSATVLNAIRVLVLLLPLSWLGAQVWGLEGVFWGRLATDFTVGAIGLTWLSHAFRAITRDKAA